jgi:hypothetical protein
MLSELFKKFIVNNNPTQLMDSITLYLFYVTRDCLTITLAKYLLTRYNIVWLHSV